MPTPGATADYSGSDFYIEPVLRAYLTSSTTRPYLEIFAGYGYADFDVEEFTPGTGFLTTSDDGEGLTYGAGLGVEFIAASSISGPLTLSVGVELRETNLHTDLYGDLDHLGVLGTVMFGTRW